MNPLAARESRLMRILLGGEVRFIQAEKNEIGNWNYHEGKKKIISGSKYNPIQISKRLGYKTKIY